MEAEKQKGEAVPKPKNCLNCKHFDRFLHGNDGYCNNPKSKRYSFSTKRKTYYPQEVNAYQSCKSYEQH